MVASITAICGLFARGVYPSWNPRDERQRIQESREKNHYNGDSYHGLVVVGCVRPWTWVGVVDNCLELGPNLGFS